MFYIIGCEQTSLEDSYWRVQKFTEEADDNGKILEKQK